MSLPVFGTRTKAVLFEKPQVLKMGASKPGMSLATVSFDAANTAVISSVYTVSLFVLYWYKTTRTDVMRL